MYEPILTEPYTMPRSQQDSAPGCVPTSSLLGKRIKRRPEREAKTSGKPRKVGRKYLVRCGLCKQPVTEEPCRVCTGKGKK